MFFPSVYAAIFSTGSSGSINLLPLPAEYMTGNTAACLQEWFEVKWDQDEKHVPEDLRAAAARMMERINKSQHTYLSPTGGAEFFPTGRCENWMDSIKLSFDGSAMLENGTYPSIFDNAIKPVEERVTAESYKLVMHTHGTVMATAYTALGLFRALTSFENMLYTIEQTVPPLVAEGDPMTKPWGDNAEKAKVFYFPYTPYVITDKPAFPWRAVLLDTSRHFYSTRAIKGMLDTMASVKLNVFHWHIVDAQSWPLVLHGLEELAEKGAYSPRKTYSGADVRDIVRYAGERGIDVVIEIDTPGHTKSIAGAFPEYVACGTTSHWGGYANEPPAGQLRFADPEVTSFTSKIFAATAKLTRSPYFSTGGDELNEKCMLEDGPTLEALAANDWTLNDALRVFTNKTHATLRERGITPTVWQEMVLAHGDLELPKDTIVDVWIMASNVRAVLDKGYRVVHASADYFYLDCGQGGWITVNGGSDSWCPYRDWSYMFSFDPFANVTAAQQKLVLGGQASLWCELTDETNFESVMWPRAAAVAELWWSGGPWPRDAVAALPRMHDTRYRMVERGVRAEPLQPEWCAMHPGQCNRKS